MSQNLHLDDYSLELSKIFHEIKNPLTLIDSSLQLIQAEHPEVKDFRFWNQTMKDLRELRSLLENLSAFEKSGLLHKTLINLFDFTEDLSESVEAFLQNSGIPFLVENSIADLDFYADNLKLRQAIVNLIKNAAESSKKGQPIILRISKDGNLLSFAVIDHGHGIPLEQLGLLFEPFHTTKSYGTGLGLPIAQRIALSHQGTLSVQSTQNHGSVFTLSVPMT